MSGMEGINDDQAGSGSFYPNGEGGQALIGVYWESFMGCVDAELLG